MHYVEYLTHSPQWDIFGWTLLHFLWIGSAIWLIAATGRRAIHRRSPAIRYAYSVGCLLILTASPIVVFRAIAAAATSESALGAPAISTNAMGGPADANSPPLASSAATDTDADSADLGRNVDSAWTRVPFGPRLASVLPGCWAIGFSATLGTMFLGIVGVERLRRTSRSVDDPETQKTFERLKARLGVTLRATVALSERIASPILIGILRPALLLPSAALTGLTPEQIELVLLHELAHVRRRDNLINLLQRMAEAFLFFHPAVWTLSNWVRLEREYCCDDVVVANTNQTRESYARTLAQFALSPQTGVLAAAMARGPLIPRIRNILQQEDTDMKINSKTFIGTAACCAALSVAVFAALSTPIQSNPQPGSGAVRTPGADANALTSVEDLLDAVGLTYKRMTTFAASGEVITESKPVEPADPAAPIAQTDQERLLTAEMAKPRRTDFTMRLKRGGKFRLDWSQPLIGTFKPGGSAWSLGEMGYYRPSFQPEAQAYSAKPTLFGAIQGVSSGIPAVPKLFYDLDANIFPLRDRTLERVESIDGVPCQVVTGHASESSEVTLWIASNSRLIKRYRIEFNQSLMTRQPPDSEEHEKTLNEHPELRRSLEMAKQRIFVFTTTFRDMRVDGAIPDEDLVPSQD